MFEFWIGLPNSGVPLISSGLDLDKETRAGDAKVHLLRNRSFDCTELKPPFSWKLGALIGRQGSQAPHQTIIFRSGDMYEKKIMNDF